MLSILSVDPSWQSDIIRRDILTIFDANAIMNSDICGLPREKIMHAPMIFLLCLPLSYNRKITTCCSNMPVTSFVGLEILSHISKEVDLCLMSKL